MDGTDVHGRLMTIKTHLSSCLPLNVQAELTHSSFDDVCCLPWVPSLVNNRWAPWTHFSQWHRL